MTTPPQYPTSHEAYDRSAEESPVAKLWYGILNEGLTRRGERIHVSPGSTPDAYTVRLYVDGAWEEIINPPAQMYPALIQRLKLMANLSLVRRVALEQGVFRLAVGSLIYDLKVTKRIRSDGIEEAMIELPAAPVSTSGSRR